MGAKLGEADWLAYLLEARQQERARISQALHDEVGQVLSAAGLQLDLLRLDCGRVADVAPRIAEAQKLLEQAVAQVRELSYALDPGVVERAGLRGALERLIERWRKSFSGEIRFCWEIPAQLPPATAQAFYQVAELALENAIRDLQARRVEISLRRGRRGLCLEIRAEGPRGARSAVGDRRCALALRLMRRQAERGGLVFYSASRLESGTIVNVLYPLSRRTAVGAGSPGHG